MRSALSWTAWASSMIWRPAPSAVNFFSVKVFEAENEVYLALRVEAAARHVFSWGEARNDSFPIAENVGFNAR